MKVTTTAYRLTKAEGLAIERNSEGVVLRDNLLCTLGDICDIAKNEKILEDIEPTKYTIEFLTEYHQPLIRKGYNISISYLNRNEQKRIIYLKVTPYQRQKLSG